LFVGVVIGVAVRLEHGRPDAALRGLEGDLIARYEPLGGRLVSTSKQNADRSGFLGKPVHAEYRRMFKLPPGADPRAQVQHALRAARAAGWQIEEHSDGAVSEFLGSLHVSGYKPLPSRETKRVAITVFTDASQLSSRTIAPPAMLIRLSSPETD
jgi:hypothetical protein